jgi:hypothetical protein
MINGRARQFAHCGWARRLLPSAVARGIKRGAKQSQLTSTGSSILIGHGDTRSLPEG